MTAYRSWLWVLTLWFALLQTMAPLLHAHAAGDSAVDDGPHIHMVDIPALHQAAVESKHAFHWHVHSNQSHGQIIGLGQAITEKNDLFALIAADANLWLVVLPLSFFIFPCGLLLPRRFFARQQNDRAPSLTSLTRHCPRAPPDA